MRSAIALLALCILAVPAAAQPITGAPPSRTLERAIKLYDKKDFYSASIELTKVLQGESGDDEANQQRARFFQGKTYYQLGFYAPSWSHFAQITQLGPTHLYFAPTAKWVVALLHAAPSANLRAMMFVYRDGKIVDDPTMESVRDELAYQLGRELAGRDVPADEALAILARVAPTSEFAPAAQLEIARVKLRGNKDLRGGIAAAMAAARNPKLAGEAIELIAGAAPRDPALAELARTYPYARFEHSRGLVDSKLPGLAGVSVAGFDAVMLASACRGSWPDDIKPLARKVAIEANNTTVKLLSYEDNAELYEAIKQLQRSPAMPGSDVVLAMLASDPGMQERVAWLAELDKELQLVQRSDRAWQTTQTAAEVLQELTVVQAVEFADAGAHARRRLQQLARDLDALEHALAAAPPAVAVSAGPDVKPGNGLVVTGELCLRAASPAIAGGSTPTTKPTSGCAGCSTRDASWSCFVLAAIVLAGRRRLRRR